MLDKAPDGKIVVAGVSFGVYGNFALARYLIDGSLDTSFGTNGLVTTDFGADSSDYGYSVALQPDGRIVVAGNSSSNFALARYQPDGSLDTSFGTNGLVTTGFGASSDGYSVALQPDGKIVVAGYNYGSSSNFALARYQPDGKLDTNFGTKGLVTTDFGADTSDYGYSVALQPDGKILVAGSSGEYPNDNFALARYQPDGSLDTSFGTNGLVTTDFGAGDVGYSVALQPDGKIVVAGYSSDYSTFVRFALARYLPNGSLDSGFGTNGLVTKDFGAGTSDYGKSLALQPDGKIVVAGFTSGSSIFLSFALARYQPDGSLDTSFGTNGLVTTDFGAEDRGYSLALQPDGKIVVAGSSNEFPNGNVDFALARYGSDGSLDRQFGPIENTLAHQPSVNEQGSVTLGASARIFDPELLNLGTYDGATLTLQRQGGANAEDEFASAGNGLTNLLPGSYLAVHSVTIGRVLINSGGTLQLRFMGTNATQARVDYAMQQIAYRNASDRPPVQVRIDWTFDDGNTGPQGTGGALSTTGTVTVNITPLNDAPRLVNAPRTQTAIAKTAFNYTLPADTFRDPDGDPLTWYLSMADGTGMPPWLNFNPATRELSGTPTEFDIGTLNLRVTVNDPADGTAYADFPLQVVPGVLMGLAAQGYVGTDNQVQFGAFTIQGDSRRVLIRGLGPALNGYVPGAIDNPKIALSLNGAPTPLEVNDDWADAGNAAEIAALNHQPKNATESAILRTLEPGIYNLHLSGSGGSTGIGMFQVYAVDGGGNGELKGLAAQGQVGTGNQVQFGAFTIIGKPRKVLIRGLGPALNGYVPGALSDPQIALSLNGAPTPIETNDNWADAGNAAEIAALNHQPKNATESAILRTLEPGIYNVHLSGSGGNTGIGMFQVYTVE